MVKTDKLGVKKIKLIEQELFETMYKGNIYLIYNTYIICRTSASILFCKEDATSFVTNDIRDPDEPPPKDANRGSRTK